MPEGSHRRGDSPRGGLVAACLQGEAGAWEALVRGHAAVVYAVIQRSGFAGAEAEELFHRVWLTAWDRLGTLRDEDEFEIWLAILAARQVRQALRHHPAADEPPQPGSSYP